MSANDYKTTRAVVIERPFEANVREIKLTEPKEDAFVARTYFSAISTGTDMKTYKGQQHPEQCWYPLVPGYETVVVIGAGMNGVSAIQCLKILEPTLQVICIEENSFRRSIAENYADIVVAPENAVKVIADATNGKMADQLMECSGNPEVVSDLYKYIKDGGWGDDDTPAHIHLNGDYPDRIIFDHYHRWFVKNAQITMTCALAAGCKEQILQWISEGKFDTSKLPYEVWPVSKAKEAFEHQAKAGADCFKILFDWSK